MEGSGGVQSEGRVAAGWCIRRGRRTELRQEGGEITGTVIAMLCR
jgi:hypothetical protein